MTQIITRPLIGKQIVLTTGADSTSSVLPESIEGNIMATSSRPNSSANHLPGSGFYRYSSSRPFKPEVAWLSID
ncbi:hypothetical protein H8F21_03755 [Pseudomonas sp. P66]|jgi:hypothetical protein|uniref:Uncharacterized protein n=1 Tax=Pseudomonas arcuscaelestis TaxID=2710591 RepID=A0ABS2BSS4_9PSED|nr:hypothetical protein [Pseudomonas arcuscaelestis]MBM3103821.1 hypothetical protein [Pseudomonas arcuscaelestis]MBM3111262.1 hypothetical protein [Pseudomonas arcuscaelestis]MBM5456684.1 hypothetical protein [Pseudomonas arcuscaelestis]